MGTGLCPGWRLPVMGLVGEQEQGPGWLTSLLLAGPLLRDSGGYGQRKISRHSVLEAAVSIRSHRRFPQNQVGWTRVILAKSCLAPQTTSI